MPTNDIPSPSIPIMTSTGYMHPIWWNFFFNFLERILDSADFPDIMAIEALTGTGLLTRTADDTWALRTVTGTTNRITLTDGNGVSGNPTVDISSSYVGQATITTLGTITTGTWNGDVVDLAYGGTNANLTANNGGIFYSTGTAGAILAGTATANQVLLSGSSAAPSWSTFTTPGTYAQGDVLYSSAANVLAGLTKDTNSTRYLSNQGSSNNPSWNQVNLANGVTGTLPIANGGTAVTAIPKFRAYRGSTQAITTATFTKVQLDTETFDTNSNFDNATNYRFTPTVAGYYKINGTATFNFSAGDTNVEWAVILYKNGTVYSQVTSRNTIASATVGLCVSDVINFNGSTDYVELYVYQAAGADRNINGSSNLTYLSGSLIPG